MQRHHSANEADNLKSNSRRSDAEPSATCLKKEVYQRFQKTAIRQTGTWHHLAAWLFISPRQPYRPLNFIISILRNDNEQPNKNQDSGKIETGNAGVAFTPISVRYTGQKGRK